MSGLDLDIYSKDGKTHTKFRMKWYETITFHNSDPKAPLTVTIQGDKGAGPVLERNGDAYDKEIKVPSGGSSQSFKICPAYTRTATSFKYTARIEGADVEDPIVIIEK